MSLRDLLKRIYRKLPKPPNTNYLFRKIPTNPYELLPPEPVIYDIGSGSAGGSYVFGQAPGDAQLVCLDIKDGPFVDLVADIHNLSIVEENSVDLVICISVLEHVRYPQKAIAEIFRILKPGGIIYVNVPFVFPFHADPSDFYRFSHKGVEILCEDYEKIDSGFNRGPASTMCHLSVHMLAILLSFNSQTIYSANVYILSWLLFWTKYLDVFLAKFKMAHVIHSGAYFIGKKPGA